MTLPLNARVTWARNHHLRNTYRVTGHPQPGYVELDGSGGGVAESMLELVPDDERDKELAELRELVALQAEIIAGMSA